MKYSCSVQTQTVYIMEMPQQQWWNSELLWGRLWEYRGRPMRYLPNTLRILKNILMIFCYMRNNIRNIFFLVTEIGCGISQTFAIWDCTVIQRSGSYKEHQFAFVLLGCSEWWHTSQNQTGCRKRISFRFWFLSKNGIVFYYTDEHFIQKRTSYRLDCAKDTDCLSVYKCKVATFRRRRYETHETQ